MTIPKPANLMSLQSASSPMTTREAAKEILWHRNEGLSWKASQFLGQVVGLPERPLSPAQQASFEQLVNRAGLVVEGAPGSAGLVSELRATFDEFEAQERGATA